MSASAPDLFASLNFLISRFNSLNLSFFSLRERFLNSSTAPFTVGGVGSLMSILFSTGLIVMAAFDGFEQYKVVTSMASKVKNTLFIIVDLKV